MARMGDRPIEVPDSVEVTEEDGTLVAEGPNGTLRQSLAEGITADLDEDRVVLHRRDDSRKQKSQHGLHRTLVKNIVTGVSEGFTKTLELNGLGYRSRLEGSTLVLELGYSNPVRVDVPDSVDVELPNETTIKISGIDNEEVGHFAAELRKLRDPDPYNQKGVKYEGEYIRQKVGKAVGGGEGEGMGTS